MSDVLTIKPDLIEQMALFLDREMRLIPNWKHFSHELKVDVNVINRLEQYADFSPTIRLFEYLETAQPNLSIQQLKQAFLDIRRNDLFSLLTTTGLPLCDVSVVLTPWTARNHPFKSPGGGGGGYSGFQVTGTGFEIFDSGFFGVVKFGKYFVGWPALSRNFFGYSEHDSVCVSRSRNI